MTQREAFESKLSELLSQMDIDAQESFLQYALDHVVPKLRGAKAQAAQPAPRRLTEAEITLLVEAYYEDFGSAPPDLIRQVEGLIFGDAQPAHAHAIDAAINAKESK